MTSVVFKLRQYVRYSHFMAFCVIHTFLLWKLAQHMNMLDTVLPWIPSAHWKWKYLACTWIWRIFVCLFCWIFVFNLFALGKKWFSVIQGAFYVFKNPPMIKADKQGPGLLLELFYQLFEKCSGKFFSYNLFIAIPQKPTVTSTITACTKSAESW